MYIDLCTVRVYCTVLYCIYCGVVLYTGYLPYWYLDWILVNKLWILALSKEPSLFLTSGCSSRSDSTFRGYWHIITVY